MYRSNSDQVKVARRYFAGTKGMYPKRHWVTRDGRDKAARAGKVVTRMDLAHLYT